MIRQDQYQEIKSLLYQNVSSILKYFLRQLTWFFKQNRRNLELD
jgi:hypothetical protein